MSHLLIFGLGYTAKRIAASLEALGWSVEATGSAGSVEFSNADAVNAAIERATHILSSVPPDRATGDDPVLASYKDALKDHALYYLSSTGVYGDQQGAWVDEATPTVVETGAGRRNARAEADAR